MKPLMRPGKLAFSAPRFRVPFSRRALATLLPLAMLAFSAIVMFKVGRS